MVQEIRIADYDYPLPDALIARHPCTPRDACRLLLADASHGREASHRQFTELPELLTPDTLMVCNNTRVINARIRMAKATGAVIEIFCLEPEEPADYEQAFQARRRAVWTCLIGNLKRWKEGPLTAQFKTPAGVPFTLTATLGAGREDGSHLVTFSWQPPELSFAEVLSGAGYIPIPPYLCRESQQSDTVDYQTVYSKIKGSVAAPTAGLHFTDALMERIRQRGVTIAELTLHVGAGTFKPVKSETIGEHPMHTETVSITAPLLSQLIEAVQSHRPLLAVGTTTVRTLESLPYLGALILTNPEIEPWQLHVGQWDPYTMAEFDTVAALRAIAEYMDRRGMAALTASTAIMIAPGFAWRICTEVLTNFHQPQSTLLLLVASFIQQCGARPEMWREYYDAALSVPYRFLSYGDAMLIR